MFVYTPSKQCATMYLYMGMGKHSRKLPNDERTDRANFLLLENEFQA